MSSPSPTCQVKDGASAYGPTTNGVNVTPANTITINLISSAGVSTWAISCISTDELSVAATVTASLVIDTVAKTATFTAPSAGKAYIFQSVVNGGVDTNGVVQASYTTTFGIFTLTSARRVHAVGETFESDPVFGWVTDFNSLIRSPSFTQPTGNFLWKSTSSTLDGATVQVTDSLVATGAAIAVSKLAASGTTDNILKSSAGTTVWGTINLASSNAVGASLLPAANGGTGITTAASTGLAKVAAGTWSVATLVNADVNAAAAIAYSKLNLATSIVNADVNAAAAIAYSKLNLATSIVNADVAAAAAIAGSKLFGTGTETINAQQFDTNINAKGTERTVSPKNVSTSDATVTTIDSFTLASNTSVIWTVIIAAVKSDHTQSAGYSRTAVFQNNGGTVTLIGAVQDGGTFESDATWDATLDFTGTTVRARVTGKAATTIQWTCISQRLEVIP